MAIHDDIRNAVLVRQSSVDIAADLARLISPILAEKLSAMPELLMGKRGADMGFQRKRITVEFFYEQSGKNPWGDFATWNITETEVYAKTVTTTKSHFPDPT